MTDSRQAWLESLDPRVRAEVEAEIADYEDPDNAEYVEEGDWEPGADFRFEIGVAFTREELALLAEAVGRGSDASAFIKSAALEQMQALYGDPSRRSPVEVEVAPDPGLVLRVRFSGEEQAKLHRAIGSGGNPFEFVREATMDRVQQILAEHNAGEGANAAD